MSCRVYFIFIWVSFRAHYIGSTFISIIHHIIKIFIVMNYSINANIN